MPSVYFLRAVRQRAKHVPLTSIRNLRVYIVYCAVLHFMAATLGSFCDATHGTILQRICILWITRPDERSRFTYRISRGMRCSQFLVDDRFLRFPGTLLAWFLLIIRCVGVMWWLQGFLYIIFVTPLLSKIIKKAVCIYRYRGWGIASILKKKNFCLVDEEK
jgi:hypothetical protein